MPGVDLLVARPTIKNTIGDPFFLALYLERKAVALARSDRNGIAVVEGLRPGTFMAVPHQSIDRTPFYAEQLDGSPPHVEIPDHGEVHLELHLRPAGMIVGTCRSASGDLAGSVTVKSSWRGEAVPGNPYRSRQSTSDALGTYALFLRPGSYWTYPSPRRESLVYGMPQQMEVQIDLGPGEVFHKDWVFGAGEGWITGTLLDQHGEAWSGATVRVARILDVELGKPNSRSDVLARTVVQKDGGFRVGPFPDGSYEVRFGVPGHDTAGPGGLGEYPIPATALIAGAGDHSCGTSLAYRWDNVEVEVMLDLGTRVSAQTLTVTAETPGFHPDRPEIRRTQELTPDRERKYLLQYSRHKEGQVLLRVQGPGVDLEHTINIGTEPGAWFPVILAID